MKTIQQIFTHVVTSLRAQGCKSIDYSTCMLRGPSGARCALGHLIPDSVEITEGMEKNSDAGVFMRTYPAICAEAGIDTESWQHRQLVLSMQYIHDVAPVEKWEDRWQALAEALDLDFPPAA